MARIANIMIWLTKSYIPNGEILLEPASLRILWKIAVNYCIMSTRKSPGPGYFSFCKTPFHESCQSQYRANRQYHIDIPGILFSK